MSRIVYCPKGHRTEVTDEHYKEFVGDWFEISMELDRRTNGCAECHALIYQVRPYKAKRTGES